MATQKQNLTAIIYDKRGRVLSVGKNDYLRTHTLQARHANKVGLPEKIYIHAETDAITKCKDLSKAHTIKVFRTNKKGHYMMAKPCKVCMSVIEEAGIPNIQWTTGGLVE